MCGFTGLISQHPIEEKQFSRSLSWIARRGPDAANLWLSQDGRIGLIHARLAIVDKDPKADQPFQDKDSGLTVAFTGEIYNFKELKRQIPSFLFRTETDTEVIAAVINNYGLKGLDLLKGMFSMVIIDQRNKKIFLARDPIGKKPLFIARWQQDVFFGVSVLALAAADNKTVVINQDVLPYYWKNAFIHPAASALSGVKPILPGQVLELDWQGNLINETRINREKKYSYNGESLEKVNTTIGVLLKEAVAKRLENNPKPVVLLSGGIDSTLICKISQFLCKESSKPLEVITLRSFIPLTQDEWYARFAAYKMNLKLNLVKPGIKNIPSSLMKAIDLQDEPLGMPSFFLLERLVNAASVYGEILLTGDGGDEIFLGYGKPADWYAQENLNQKRNDYGLGIPSWMSQWARQTLTDCLIGHMLAKTDRACAEQGVEARCPLLDQDLISYVHSLPFRILTADGTRAKALLKSQLKGWPRWFLERPKIGFAYNLRWQWAISNYAGMRESVDNAAVETFEPYLACQLRCRPNKWKLKDIFDNFEATWRLLVWSRFLERLRKTRS